MRISPSYGFNSAFLIHSNPQSEIRNRSAFRIRHSNFVIRTDHGQLTTDKHMTKKHGFSILAGIFALLILSAALWGAAGPTRTQGRFSQVESGSKRSGSASVPDWLVYIGTYTRGDSRGIYAFRMNSATGSLRPLGLAAEIVNPSFLAVHPNQNFLYAVTETSQFREKPSGAVSAFAIDHESGKLRLLNQQSSGGAGPCYVTADPTGSDVLVANYGGGSVAVLPIEKDGSLRGASALVQHSGSSVNSERQKEPHAHSINVDPKNRFAVAADLGIDKLLVYRFNAAKGTLQPNDPPFATVSPGAGPRHFTFHPSGRWAYVINELHCTVTVFSYDAKNGILKEIQTVSTLPVPAQDGYSTAEIRVHPSGKFLYGSNRGHDSIAVFSIDKRGMLTSLQHISTQGKTPRNFGLDPPGTWLLAANQNSDSVVVFRIDATAGRLSPAGQTIVVPSPVCVRFVKIR
ncbi:MAG TPA: lactonase family protein [Acidobacteriota bacterium]|nr:lactonase family protein [Acidobacteriota bacterium]